MLRPSLSCSGCDRSTCRLHVPKAARLYTKRRPLSPSKCNLYSDYKICGRCFISARLSASLHGLSRNTFISYLHYNFLYSECMQKNIVWTTDIKVVGACPSNRFNKKHLFVRVLKPESFRGLISILVSSHSRQSWQVMDHISPALI